MDTLVTQTIHTDGMSGEAMKSAEKHHSVASQMSGWVTLQLLESGQFLPLAERNEFTLGRVSEGQPIMPDVDLTPYRAYECGVSRLHTVLKKIDDRIVIMDLGSSNGTFVNGNRLEPNKEYPLAHGNIISLGKLKIQVLLKNL
ncbi:MAG: FHA domain-containing protein [Chloroflexi bacterium]|nr:FHA domain-containing protein [Chloroflexota bacterium]